MKGDDMFRRLANTIPGGANSLFLQHPSVLSTSLEVAWQFRVHNSGSDLGLPDHRSNLPQVPDYWLNQLRNAAVPPINPPSGGSSLGPSWEHLVYAYMIENTRIYEIIRRVLHEYVHGEKLGVPEPAAQHWLRNTEELFYRDFPPFAITSISSQIRPDVRAIRRNAYWRMFGMDLNHGTDDGQPYPYIKADACNNEFVTTFEEFLREAWIAISNINNTSGTNPTDASKIGTLAERLSDMLRTRRLNGNLSREEFVAVSMMSWFHLTMEYDSPIVVSLRAEASSSEQRLFKVAQRVGVPAHGLSKSYFDIADAIARILVLIETGGINTVPSPPTPTFTSSVLDDLTTIVTHWSLVTGRDMKARRVATT